LWTRKTEPFNRCHTRLSTERVDSSHKAPRWDHSSEANILSRVFYPKKKDVENNQFFFSSNFNHGRNTVPLYSSHQRWMVLDHQQLCVSCNVVVTKIFFKFEKTMDKVRWAKKKRTYWRYNPYAIVVRTWPNWYFLIGIIRSTKDTWAKKRFQTSTSCNTRCVTQSFEFPNDRAAPIYNCAKDVEDEGFDLIHGWNKGMMDVGIFRWPVWAREDRQDGGELGDWGIDKQEAFCSSSYL